MSIENENCHIIKLDQLGWKGKDTTYVRSGMNRKIEEHQSIQQMWINEDKTTKP